MGVLDKIFGKKQDIQPPTIPVSEQLVPEAPVPTPVPEVSQMMSLTVPQPIEPRPIMPMPEVQPPSIEERRVEDVIPNDVFVKVDNFGEILSELTMIKANLVNVKALGVARAEMRDLDSDIGNLVQAYNDELEKSLANVETILEGVSGAARKVKDVKFKAARPEKAKSVGDLEDRIKKLRGEIEGLNKTKR